jgi:hypothetical protein
MREKIMEGIFFQPTKKQRQAVKFALWSVERTYKDLSSAVGMSPISVGSVLSGHSRIDREKWQKVREIVTRWKKQECEYDAINIKD